MFKLSITGADNLVNINELKKLIEIYNKLELAILYFPEKENLERNPGVLWRNKFFEEIPKFNTAIHLCGEQVFNEILSKNFKESLLFNELKKTQRIQININARKDIFSDEQIHKIYNVLLNYDFEIILQYHQRSKNYILPFIKNNKSKNINILLDSSLGKGILSEKFEIPEELNNIDINIGFAGGLNPENIHNVYEQVKKINVSNFWLDLESGVRTNNKFDIVKAIKLCQNVFEK